MEKNPHFHLKKNSRLRFSYEDDVYFLREFIIHNPYKNPDSWLTIKQNLLKLSGKNFVIKTLKQHLYLLLDAWSKKVKLNSLRSGVKETITERDQLLKEITKLCRESHIPFIKKRKSNLSREEQICQLVKQTKAEDCNTQSSININEIASSVEYPDEIETEEITVKIEKVDDDYIEESENTQSEQEITSPTSDPLRAEISKSNTTILSPTLQKENIKRTFLTDQQIKMKTLNIEERKLKIEERKLDLEEKKLSLQEAIFDLDRKERLEKLDSKKETQSVEIKAMQHLIESQKLVIEILTKNNNSSNSN